MSAQDFLQSYQFNLDALDLPAILADFLAEMKAGLQGKPSSLAMIPAYIEPSESMPQGKSVCAFDAGGTNLRSARIALSKYCDTTSLVNFQKGPMPGTQGLVDEEAFYGQLAHVLAPNIHDDETFGFCFSYPGEILANHDCKLAFWTKQIQAPDIVGQCVGAGLSAYLANHGLAKNTTPILLNDTVATLLAAYGCESCDEAGYGAYVGFILGTGTNSAYCEKVSNITKITATGDRMAINCESGNFSKVPQSDFDRILEATSDRPGAYRLEKCMSGVYLGQLGTIALRHLAADGLLSESTTQAINAHDEPYTNIELDNFCHRPDTSLFGDNLDDQALICSVLKAIYLRAAYFAAVNLAATTICAHRASGKRGKVCINADGSTFHKTHAIDFQAAVHHTLSSLLKPYEIDYEIIQIDDAPLIGAAIAAASLTKQD